GYGRTPPSFDSGTGVGAGPRDDRSAGASNKDGGPPGMLFAGGAGDAAGFRPSPGGRSGPPDPAGGRATSSRSWMRTVGLGVRATTWPASTRPACFAWAVRVYDWF